HARRPGVILLAVQSDAIVPNADDRLDHADAQPAGVERVALLDMRFKIADIMPGIDPLARTLGKAGTSERLAQRCAIIPTADLVDLFFGKHTGKRAAAEKALVVTFLIRPSGDLDAELGAAPVGGKCAGELKAID